VMEKTFIGILLGPLMGGIEGVSRLENPQNQKGRLFNLGEEGGMKYMGGDRCLRGVGPKEMG